MASDKFGCLWCNQRYRCLFGFPLCCHKNCNGSTKVMSVCTLRHLKGGAESGLCSLLPGVSLGLVFTQGWAMDGGCLQSKTEVLQTRLLLGVTPLIGSLAGGTVSGRSLLGMTACTVPILWVNSGVNLEAWCVSTLHGPKINSLQERIKFKKYSRLQADVLSADKGFIFITYRWVRYELLFPAPYKPGVSPYMPGVSFSLIFILSPLPVWPLFVVLPHLPFQSLTILVHTHTYTPLHMWRH